MNKIALSIATITILSLITISCNRSKANGIETEDNIILKDSVKIDSVEQKKTLTIDTVDYNKRMIVLSNNDTTGRWPVKTPYPLPGAILPYNRIIAFYGNLYSTRMGVLGEYPRQEMIAKLKGEVANWQAADSTVKAIPALHYIAVTAQGAPGKNNMHRLRMPFKQIDTVISWAKPIDALVFLDIQVGHSTVKEEVEQLRSYFALPNVHLGIDPEFSMKNGERPGSKIGYFTANDINDAIDILADEVRKNNLPPKVLVVHRFTQGMIKNYKNIKIVPEVQIVIHMDGFGSKVLKRSTYLSYIYREPVQFTGFKLFYKNDNWNDWKIYQPEELVKFTPKPLYIQYQ
ncbi:hypothetical protein RCH18_000548 [Flavobacterium sp. PL11]|jgi:hypothetical protein|uniref:hypothetical protein n=1 Tax=Flavobacterium sp. PL11 TaxID=3071717 RepID=UPI002DF73901|nr:hypothetical protein [Flavobacterium sp. PL11]